MGKTERREETDEAGRTGGDTAGSLPRSLEDSGLISDAAGAVARRRRSTSTLREYVESLLWAILLALFVRTFVVQAFKIPSGSMIPTLQIGDHILVNKFIYGIRIPFTDGRVLVPIRTPKRGDVVVFRFPKDKEKDFIKRVIGVPGDTIQIKNKRLFLNGEAQRESYAVYDRSSSPHGMPERDNFGPVSVPENAYFVMGDNRDHSLDSRFWGFVNFSELEGKAFLIYWSWDSEATWVRWDRIADIVR